jgi:hypothetical protein
MTEAREEDYMFLPLDQVTAPASGQYFHLWRNAWWLVCPERGLAFYNPVVQRTGKRTRSYLGWPQCNVHESITRGTILRNAPFPAEVRQFLFVFEPISISDYKD